MVFRFSRKKEENVAQIEPKPDSVAWVMIIGVQTEGVSAFLLEFSYFLL